MNQSDSEADRWRRMAVRAPVVLASLAILLAPLALLALPPAAQGATASLRVPAGEDDYLATFEYRAGPGERNTVEVDVSLGEVEVVVTATDSGAPVDPGAGCVSEGAHSVRCAYQEQSSFLMFDADIRLLDGGDSARMAIDLTEGRFADSLLDGGSGDDRLTVAAPQQASPHRLHGGPGNDTLTGGNADELLNGGGGRDELHGEGGFNVLRDGDRSGSVDADVLDGGGDGLLSYGSRTRPLRVDLADRGRDGERGEGDLVRGVRHVTGGRGDDVLAGTAAANELLGGGGSDRIVGGAGPDYIRVGGAGLASGGAGNDRISPTDAPSVMCGPGADTIEALPIFPGAGPWLSGTCERATPDDPYSSEGALVVRPPRPIAAGHDGRLVFRIPCNPYSTKTTCRQTLTITVGTAPARIVARREVSGPARQRLVALRLPLRVLRRARRGPVRLGVRLRFAPDGHVTRPGRALVWRFDLNLRRPRR